MRVNIGFPVVRTDGRAYGHVITKFSRMGRLPHFLSYGAPSTRALRARVELRYKRFVQVTGLCGPQFLSSLPKRFMHLCKALYGDAILVYIFGAPIWPPEIPILASRTVKTR